MGGRKDTSVADAKQFWTGYWRGLYATPRAWAHKGERLAHAFQAVADKTDSSSMHLDMREQALMLAGMAIEVSGGPGCLDRISGLLSVELRVVDSSVRRMSMLFAQ